MLLTMSASDPLPVDTLVAVIDPVVSRELFTWLWDVPDSMVPVMSLPPGPFSVMGPPGVTVLRVLEVPSTLTTPSTPVAAAAMVDRPRVPESIAPGDLQALARTLIDGGEDQVAVGPVSGLEDTGGPGARDGALQSAQQRGAAVAPGRAGGDGEVVLRAVDGHGHRVVGAGGDVDPRRL